MLRIDLHGLLGHHVRSHAAVSKRLSFMMRSMFADQPYSEVVSTQGESAMRELTKTFSTLSPNTSFMSFVKGSNSALSSSNFFFSSSSSKSKPSFVVDFNFLPSNSLSC